MHALTVEEEELEGLPPGEVNNREYMAQVSLVIQKGNILMCINSSRRWCFSALLATLLARR